MGEAMGDSLDGMDGTEVSEMMVEDSETEHVSFDDIDTNHDDLISHDEMAENAPEMLGDFDEMDRNQDGFVGREEYLDYNVDSALSDAPGVQFDDTEMTQLSSKVAGVLHGMLKKVVNQKLKAMIS